MEDHEKVNPYNKLQALEAIPEADEKTLETASSPDGIFDLSKLRLQEAIKYQDLVTHYAILKAMSFFEASPDHWTHPVLQGDTIYFDSDDPLILIAARIYKAGYQNAKNEKLL